MDESLDIHGLVDSVTIEDISFMEISAVRDDAYSKNNSTENFDVEPVMRLQIGRNENERNFRIRIRIEIDAQPGHVLVDGAVEYAVEGFDVSQITEKVMLEFANKVGVFALIPYLRQSISDITQRVFGTPLVMPVYRQGEIDFGSGGENDMVTE